MSVVRPPGELVGDTGYDANHLRRFLAERGTSTVIPSTSSRKVPIPHDAERYRLRNIIERTFCRIKDFRGIATRYDRTARNLLAAVCLVSAITYWA
ncbi:MAG: transposase [Acetobacteraceae bacterium]|nr:transposase [Acetobacteraceae bacterium]